MPTVLGGNSLSGLTNMGLGVIGKSGDGAQGRMQEKQIPY